MKTKQLKETLAVLKMATAFRAIQPILGNVYMNGRMMTTNLDMWAIANIDTGLSTTVDLKKLETVLKNINTDEVLLETEENEVFNLKADALKISMRSMPSDEFPLPPKFKATHSIKIPFETFSKGVKKLSLSTADYEYGGDILAGISFVVDRDGLEMASTNGSWLGTYKDKSVVSDDYFKVVIPCTYLAPIQKALEKGKHNFVQFDLQEPVENNYEGQTCIKGHPGLVSIAIGEYQFILRTLEGQYPQYRQLIPPPRDCKNQFEVNKIKLLNAIKQIIPFSNERTNIIQFHFENGKLTLKASTPDIGQSEYTLSYEVLYGEVLNTAFNYAFLQTALKNIDSETIGINQSGEITPCVLTGDDSYLALVMPVQVK